MFFGGGAGGGGFGRRTFQDSFRCHSVSLLAAEQQRDAAQLEYSDKIILPPSCLEKLAHLEISYPMIFELTNPRYLQRRLHCGVLEFIAQEGMIYLPYWMMENMHLNEGDIVHLKSASIQKGSFVKLQPQTSDFIKISNPKAVLEQARPAPRGALELPVLRDCAPPPRAAPRRPAPPRAEGRVPPTPRSPTPSLRVRSRFARSPRSRKARLSASCTTKRSAPPCVSPLPSVLSAAQAPSELSLRRHR